MSDLLFRQRINAPPSDVEPALRDWLQRVANELNILPPLSTFSGTTPESVISGSPGELAINYAAPTASTVSRLWIKVTGIGNTGWASAVTGL
jgi:hypothetical protein